MCTTAHRNQLSPSILWVPGISLEGQLCWQALLTPWVMSLPTPTPAPEDFQPCLVFSDTAEDDCAGAGQLVISLWVVLTS